MKKFVLAFALIILANIGHAQTPAIHVEKTGKGEVIIFLPGFTTPGSVWKETVEHLDKKYHSHLFTYAGFAGVPPIETPWYESVKQDILTYIKTNKLKNINVVGHSMGGNLAMDIASSVPNLVTRVVLVDALPCMRALMMPGVPAESIQYESPYSKQMLAMTNDAMAQNARMMAQNMTASADKVDTLINWSVRADRKTYVYGYVDLLRLDQRQTIGNITAKTLVLAAPVPNAELVSKNLQEQYEKLSNKTIEIAPGGKHFIMFDQPDWFYTKLNAFLGK